MGQKLGGLLGRLQGKRLLRVICDRIYSECVDEGAHPRRLLAFDDLHRATLLVYNVLNREFPGPHREPPSAREIRAAIEELRRKWVHEEALDREQFYQLISEWTSIHLRRIFVTKVCLAFAAAPYMVQITKHAGEKAPRLGKVVDKIPTPVLASVYTIGFVLLQDLRVLA